jgi:hypothetical protein
MCEIYPNWKIFSCTGITDKCCIFNFSSRDTGFIHLSRYFSSMVKSILIQSEFFSHLEIFLPKEKIKNIAYPDVPMP